MSKWESYADYNKVKAFVSTVKVVNDCAERAVALATDYYKVSIIYFISPPSTGLTTVTRRADRSIRTWIRRPEMVSRASVPGIRLVRVVSRSRTSQDASGLLRLKTMWPRCSLTLSMTL